MAENEPFILNEVDSETPKQSQTWPMEKTRLSRFQQEMSSLSSPATPKRKYSISLAKTLLLQCLRDSKSDPLPRRRFRVSYSDEGILMDGVLVTSASAKKVSDSPSSSLGRSSRSSIFRSQHNNTEFSSPRSESGRNQETTGSQQSSAAKEKMLTSTPKEAANPSKLQASAEPFTLTPRQASPFPYDHYNPLFPWDHPLHLQPYPYLHRPRPPFYVYQRPPPLPVLPHGSDLYDLGPTGYLKKQTPIINDPYQLDCPTNFPSLTARNPTPTRNNDPIISGHPSEPPVHTPISTPPAANLSTSTTNGSSPTVDGLDIVTKEPDLSSPSDELDKMTQTQQDLSSPSDGLDAATQEPDLSSPSDELETATQEPDLSVSAGRETMTTKKDWSPSDDKLPTFTKEEKDLMKSQGRVLPDSAFELYKYRGRRMPCFERICSEEEEDQ